MRSEKEVNHDAKPVKYLSLEGAEIHTGHEDDVMGKTADGRGALNRTVFAPEAAERRRPGKKQIMRQLRV